MLFTASVGKGGVGILTRIILTAASSLVSEVLYLVFMAGSLGWAFGLAIWGCPLITLPAVAD